MLLSPGAMSLLGLPPVGSQVRKESLIQLEGSIVAFV